MHRLTRLVKETCQRFSLLKKGEKALVGFSGGPDSLALMEVLSELGFSLAAAHVNYNLRGEESLSDERFVVDYCRRRKIRLHILRVPEGYFKNKNIQIVARKIRYSFFKKLVQKNGYQKVAVGHNLDDLVETVLLRFFKSPSIFSIGGFLPKTGILVRPLIRVPRFLIEDYLKKRGLSWRVDSSNLKPVYLRNFIRLEIVPLVEKVNPSFREAVWALSRQAFFEKKYWFDRMKPVVDAFLKGNPVKFKHIEAVWFFYFLLKEIGAKPGFKKLEEFLNVVSKTGRRLEIAPGFFVLHDYSGLVKWEDVKDFSIPLDWNREIFIKEVSKKVYIGENPPAEYIEVKIKRSSIKGEVFARNWRPGDRMKLNGMKKKLKKIWQELKVPLSIRRKIVVFCDQDRIICIPELGLVDDDYKGEGAYAGVKRG